MVEILQNCITNAEIDTLVNWFETNDRFVDERDTARSKKPTLDDNDWPKDTVINILNRLVDYDYEIEQCMFFHQRIAGLKLHTDSDGEPEKWGDNFLIPLKIMGDYADTVYFDNYYYGVNSRFVRKIPNRYEYYLRDDNNEWIYVDDIRFFMDKLDQPFVIYNDKKFSTTKKFVELIDNIYSALSSSKYKPRISDYNKIENYNPNIKFDENIRQKYLQHIPIEDLHGLTIDKIVEWKIGDIYKWPKSQLHAVSSRHSEKIGLSLFLMKK